MPALLRMIHPSRRLRFEVWAASLYGLVARVAAWWAMGVGGRWEGKGMETPNSLTRSADAAFENVRAMNHAAINLHAIPAPTVYACLGNLSSAGGWLLAEQLEHLARGLRASLTAYPVYEDDGSDPAVRTAEAAALLAVAAKHARDAAKAMDAAQSSIAGQGYRETP